MSTRLLYHAWGLRGYRLQRTEYREGAVYFHIQQPRERLCCSACGDTEVWVQGAVLRDFRVVPVGRRAIFVRLPVARVRCFACDHVRQVRIPFADPRCHYTRAFERYALDLCRSMTIKDVARHLDVSWDTIKDIQKRYLQRRFGNPKLHKLKQIAIDEIAVGKGQHYVTVVLDLASGAVVFVGEGRGADALDPFWRRLRRGRIRIRAVATDMSPAYIRAVQDNLPRAIHVFDHFHVIKLFNDKLSTLRRELYHEATTKMAKQVLKGTRWLLLKNPENLSDRRREYQRLHDALRMNAPLATAYYMKEDLRQIWDQEDKAAARQVLDDWIRRAEASGIRMLEQFARTMALHRSGILAWHDCHISTGPLEGTNTKIQVMKRQAYGFRDRAFLKLKILGIHETKRALVG
jgi:transposase